MTGLTWHQIATNFALICFLLATLEHKKYNWLGFSLTIWLLGAYYSAQILPGIFGITHWFNAYLLHGYIFMGSIFFWINHVFRLPKRATNSHIHWRSDAGIWLTLLALASLVMHIALILLLMVVGFEYPNGISIYILPAFMQLYFLQPATWWVMTAFLMFIFLLHRRIQGELPDIFSLQQIYAGVFLALLMQFTYIFFSF